jgi:glycosyltransferase involved in cell wall biosynthesis
LATGGAEKVLSDLCRNFDHNKYNIYVVALDDKNDFITEFKDVNIDVINLNMKKTPTSFYKAFTKISHIVKSNCIDVIHAHMFHPLVFANIMKIQNRDIKVVFTSHNEKIGSKFSEIYTRATKSLRDVDVLFSKDMHNDIYLDDAVVIANGVDIDNFQKDLPKNEKFTFISIGVLRYQKNQVSIPAFASKLKKRGFDFQVQIVGSGNASGDFSKEIKENIEKYSVQNEVLMLGSRRDIPDLLSKAHALILPSHFEGMPIVILEAGASSLPIISTPVGSIPEMIDERSGYLSDIDNFAQNMIDVYENYEQAQKRADNFFKKINQDYSIKSMAVKHQKIYEL